MPSTDLTQSRIITWLIYRDLKAEKNVTASAERCKQWVIERLEMNDRIIVKTISSDAFKSSPDDFKHVSEHCQANFFPDNADCVVVIAISLYPEVLRCSDPSRGINLALASHPRMDQSHIFIKALYFCRFCSRNIKIPSKNCHWNTRNCSGKMKNSEVSFKVQ